LQVGVHKAVITIVSDQDIIKHIDIVVTITEQPPNPVYIGDSTTITIPVKNCFEHEYSTHKFIIENHGGRDITFDDTGIKSNSKWLDIELITLKDNNDRLEIKCTVNSYHALLWPAGDTKHTETHDSFSVKINGKIFSFTVKLVAQIVDICEIAFVIGNNNYTVNKRVLQVNPVPFISQTGNTMVPIRPIAEPLEKMFDASIEWIPELRTVLFTLGNTTLRLVIGYQNAILELPDGSIETMPMNSPPIIVDGRTFLPPRTIAEAFNAKVDWLANQRKAVFTFTKP